MPGDAARRSSSMDARSLLSSGESFNSSCHGKRRRHGHSEAGTGTRHRRQSAQTPDPFQLKNASLYARIPPAYQSRNRPRVEDLDSHGHKIADVSGCNCHAARASNSGNLAVRERGRTPCGSARGHDLGVGSGCRTVERQNASREQIAEGTFCGFGEAPSAPAWLKQCYSGEDLCFRDSRHEELA